MVRTLLWFVVIIFGIFACSFRVETQDHDNFTLKSTVGGGGESVGDWICYAENENHKTDRRTV